MACRTAVRCSVRHMSRSGSPSAVLRKLRIMPNAVQILKQSVYIHPDELLHTGVIAVEITAIAACTLIYSILLS